MTNPYNLKRSVNFVLASTDQGTFIVNHNDYNLDAQNNRYGVGWNLFDHSSWEKETLDLTCQLLTERWKQKKVDMTILDCGANIGVHSVHWARHCYGWGRVKAYEAQPTIFHALAGNSVINNLLNIEPYNLAIGRKRGQILVPTLDYNQPSSFGSLELDPAREHENIGQPVDYEKGTVVDMVSIDSLNTLVDLIKLDIEGMELDALRGAVNTINNNHPIMLIEVIKSNRVELDQWLKDHGYTTYPIGADVVCIHQNDPLINSKILVDFLVK